MTETAMAAVHIGNRIDEVQAAAACLSVRPLLRGAARFCWIVGGILVLIFAAAHVPVASFPMLVALAMIAIGVYLYTPNPRPGSLILGALAIIAMWVNFGYQAYEVWQHSHRMLHFDPIALLVEVLLAGRLLSQYFSYRRHFAATDAQTIADLRDLADSVNKADLDQSADIVELMQKNNRVRMQRVEGYLLLVERHYIAFGKYSSLDAVRLVKPQEVAITAAGAGKPGKDIKLRLSTQGGKGVAMKMKPQYAARLAGLGMKVNGVAVEVHAAGE